MKQTGIIMSGDHPRKCQDGTKTQTRRVIKPQPPWKKENPFSWNLEACLYGQVGDRLWVRESWWKPPNELWPWMLYKADYPREDWPLDWGLKWKPSIHMPRWASRITLEITEVRVERVQEISNQDIQSEGTHGLHPLGGLYPNQWKQQFRFLWDSLNAKRGYSWEANPWVWCLSFKLIK